MATSEGKSRNIVCDDSVYILGDFDETISSDVVPAFVGLIDRKSKEKDSIINIYINSCGGYVYELQSLLALFNIARSKGIKVYTYVIGVAYSAASLLAVCSDKRFMFRNSSQLMHFGKTYAEPMTPLQMERLNKHNNEFFENSIKTYKEHTKLSEKNIRQYMSDDCFYLTAQECLLYGLCDEII